MGFFSSIDIAASGLTAQRLRMDVISQNIANVDTTRTEEGGPYKRKTVLFQERTDRYPFSLYLNDAARNLDAMTGSVHGNGVRVRKVVADKSEGPKVYDPEHPDADADGYVEKPNVNIVVEMVNMISASRSYEAGVTAMNATKTMIAKTLELRS